MTYFPAITRPGSRSKLSILCCCFILGRRYVIEQGAAGIALGDDVVHLGDIRLHGTVKDLRSPLSSGRGRGM
jgi:hypothetical protein